MRVLGRSEELVQPLTQAPEEQLWDLFISDGDENRKSRQILLRRRQHWAGLGVWAHPHYIAVFTLITAEEVQSLAEEQPFSSSPRRGSPPLREPSPPRSLGVSSPRVPKKLIY